MEYVVLVSLPHLHKHTRKQEKVQRAATKLIPGLRELMCKERLKKTKLPLLTGRIERRIDHIFKREQMDREDLVVKNNIKSKSV